MMIPGSDDKNTTTGRLGRSVIQTSKSQRLPIALFCGLLAGIAGCSGTNPNISSPSLEPMAGSTRGICSPPVGQTSVTTKEECFELNGLFSASANEDVSLETLPDMEDYRRSLRPPEPEPIAAPRTPLQSDELSTDLVSAGGLTLTEDDDPVTNTAAAPDMMTADTMEVTEEDDAVTPTETDNAVIPDELSQEDQVDCYLTGSDQPFKMRRSICVEGGGSLTPP